jgi:hypothetical protein
MSGFVRTVTTLPSRRTVAAALLALAVAFSLTQIRGRAASNEMDLPYARGYLLTGNYVASGIDLTENANPVDLDGFSTGTIHITKCNPPAVVFNCVPADADIVAAYMYWEAIVANGNLQQAAGVKFRGEDILLNDLAAVKASWADLTGSTSSCWSSGAPLKMVHFRADVLRFLPIRLDKDNKPTGKRLVTDQDLIDNGFVVGGHSVRLPMRNGNQIPESAGASLVLVYRDPNEALRKVVIYDGIDIQTSLTDTMSKTIRGIYQSSATKSAKITHIIGGGQPNNNDLITLDVPGAPPASTTISPPDPIMGGSSSQRGWSTLTYDVSSLMNPPAGKANLTGYGETVTTTLAHIPGNGGYDCLASAAVIFSTAVADRDHDGIPDGIEDSTSGLKDPPTSEFPLGQSLPNLSTMGAGSNTVSSDNPDVFIEINAMQTSGPKPHGAEQAHYPGVTTPPYTKSVPAHTHLPTPDVLAQIGDAYKAKGIRAHFDVGSVTAYKNRASVVHTDWTDVYNSAVADDYLISAGARGGEVVDERACVGTNANCQFPGYPGTVSWKVGLQVYRDSPVNDATGAEFQLNNQNKLVVPQNWAGRRRFDRERFGLFHYILYAHYRGRPRSEFPCLNGTGVPIAYPNGMSCTGPQIAANPDFHIPTSGSGVADLPGGNALITLGFWDEFLGRPFVQASTTFHELGHNYNLWHGGQPAIWGSKFPVATATSTTIEPNCKPNYLSSMSYLFQVHGLFTNDDVIALNFSGEPIQDNLEETSPETDGPLSPTPSPAYRTAWYAPSSSTLAGTLGVPEAKRYCHGEAFGSNPHMARLYTLTSDEAVDWDGDPTTGSALGEQDINFDHALNATLLGFNDWASLRLDQISAGRNAVKFQDGDFLDFGSGDFLDFGSGDFLDFGSGDFLDFGSGDFLDFGSGVIFDQAHGDFLDFGSGDFLDFGSGDFLDFGSGDFLDFGSGSERQELNFELAKDLGRTPPYTLKGCVITETAAPDCVTAPKYDANHHRSRASWKPPTFARVTLYQIYRKRGEATSLYPYPPASTPTGTSTTLSFIDPQQLPDGVPFTYRARATFDDTVISSYSKTVTIPARNDPPEVAADAYSVVKNRVLTKNAAEGVKANDNDPDSPKTLIFVQLSAAPLHGTLTLSADGSFVYTPTSGYTGPDEFWYTATNGTWTVDLPNVAMNSVVPTAVKVSITVTAR